MLIKETPEELEQQAARLQSQALYLREQAKRLKQERATEFRRAIEEQASKSSENLLLG